MDVDNMNSLIQQKGSALLPLLGATIITAGVTGYYYSQSLSIDSDSEFIRSTSQQVEQIQAAQLSCFNDLRRWCTPGELPNYFSGDVATLNGDITYNQDGDNLRFTVTMDNIREASVLSELLVNSTQSSSVTTSTIRPPSEASIFSDRLKRVASSDVSAMQMEVNLDGGSNRLDNIGSLEVENITSQNLIADVLETQRTIVNSELDIDGNRIISNSGDMTIISNLVDVNGELTVGGNATFAGSDINDVNLIDANSGDIDRVTSNIITSTDANVGNATSLSGVSNDASIATANITQLDSDNVVFDDANGVNITVQNFETNSSTIDNFESGSLVSTSVTSTNVVSDNASISDLTSGSAELVNFTANNARIQNAAINSLNGTDLNTITMASDSLVSATGVINNLTVNQEIVNDNAFLVDNNASIDSFITSGPVVIDVASVDRQVSDYINVVDIDIKDADAQLTNFRVTDITVAEVISDSATIDNVDVIGSLTAEELDAIIASASLLEVNTATIRRGNFNQLNMQSGQSDELYASLITSNNVISDSYTSDGVNANYADINRFNVDTLNVDTITSTFIADDYSGNSYFASGDFFTDSGSVNSNANNLAALYNALDECVNVTGYCTEKEPDFVLSCIGCDQRSQSFYFTSEIRVNVGECLQGCTIAFALDGLDAISGCGTRTFAAGYTGSLVCRVGSNVPSETVETFNPTVTMQNSRRNEFSNAVTASITYENTTPRNPQFRLTCTDCTQANDTGTYTSTINVQIQQCAEGCSLSFNIGSLSAVSGCSTQSFAAGYTGTVSCRVRTTLSAEQTFSGRVTATLANSLFGDDSSLFADISYENTEVASNPPQFTLTCSNCTQASTGGSYTVDLVVNVTNCAQGCSVVWNLPAFDSTSGCSNRTLSVGYSSSFTCRATKFVSEANTFTGTAKVTLTNSRTTESVQKSKSISLRNTGVTITPDLVANSVGLIVATGIFEVANNTTGNRTSPGVPKSAPPGGLIAPPSGFYDPALGDRSSKSFVLITDIIYESGNICDEGKCTFTIVSIDGLPPAPDVNGLQRYRCNQIRDDGIVFYGNSSRDPFSMCEADATLAVEHITGVIGEVSVRIRAKVGR